MIPESRVETAEANVVGEQEDTACHWRGGCSSHTSHYYHCNVHVKQLFKCLSVIIHS